MIKTHFSLHPYHYEWFAYTDNLCWGRMLLGRSKSRSEAERIARAANKGCYVIEKHRVYS